MVGSLQAVMSQFFLISGLYTRTSGLSDHGRNVVVAVDPALLSVYRCLDRTRTVKLKG
jgi:hypothetical protein